MRTIYFDMDGTLAGLFYVKDFAKKLQNGDMTPYVEARPLYNTEDMAKVIEILKENGFQIGIISYIAEDYAKECRKAKREWLKKYFPYATEIHLINKKTSKSKVVKDRQGILVDDSKKNREEWKGTATINAYRANLVKELYALVA